MSYRYLARIGALLLASALTCCCMVVTGTGAVGSTIQATSTWRVVATIGNAGHGELPGFFAATSPANAFSSWRCASCAPSTRADNVIRRWNGHGWRQAISLPLALNYPRSIIALGASSASNLWALTNTGKAGIWNGHAWAVRTLPAWVLRPSRVGDPFAQTAVFGTGNAWVFSIGALSQPTLAAHFARGSWHKVALPGAPVAIGAVAANDIWAVGITKQSLTAARPVWTAMHWNGSAWRALSLPSVRVPQGDSAGYQITAAGSRDVWLTRQVGSATRTFSVALMHWTGRWHVVRAPSAVKAVGPMAQDGHGGVWFGARVGPLTSGASALYHYNAGRWSHQAVPARNGAGATLATITWIPGTRSLWAAASTTAGSQEVGEILKYGT